jgi:Tfp pilus assembly protein PilV
MTLRGERGVGLIEVLIGGAIGSILVAGMMATFLAVARMTESGYGNIEAAALTQQTLERFRNRIACDDAWFQPATCAATGLPAPNSFDPTSATGLMPGALYGGTRRYSVIAADCDGIGGAGDCFRVIAKVNWTPPP